MSWIDTIQDIDLKVITGGGVEYDVQYFTSTVSRQMDFNVSEFVFMGKQGTLVTRGTSRGKRYDIQFMFVGDDCVTRGNKFAKDAENSNAWRIVHPYYGGLVVQPISLTFDNTVLNVTKVTGTVVETNEAKQMTPRGADIASLSTVVNGNLTADMSASISTLSSTNLTTLSDYNTSLYDLIKGKLNSLQTNLDVYTSKYHNAMAFLNPLLYSVLDIANSTQTLVFAPAYFIMDVNTRVRMFEDSLSMLGDMVTQILAMYNVPTKSQKAIYEMYGATAITGMCTSATTNIGTSYDYRPDVVDIINRIVTAHNTYLGNLDSLQSDYGGKLDSYIPNPNGITSMSNLVHATITQLINIANNAKQERVIFVSEPTNCISLTYDLYGMQLDDSTLDLFINSNKIGITELLEIKVGRRIVYYI